MDRKYVLKIFRLMAIYSLIMLSLIVFSLSLSKKAPQYTPNAESNTAATPQTEYVYIKVEESSYEKNDESSESNVVSNKYIVREHMDKIGIFSEDGVLIRSIDVYIKTLPEADRRLLKEGIEIIGKDALNALIQDYDG